MPPIVRDIEGLFLVTESLLENLKMILSKTPRVLAIRVPNNEDLQNGFQKIEGVLTNSKPKEQVLPVV